MHKPDPSTPVEESIRTFNDLIDIGKIRYWAISNFSTQQISNLLKACDETNWRRPVAIQPAYSLLKRDIEMAVLPLCQKEQIAVLPYQVLQGGMLTGKYRRGEAAPARSRQIEKPEWTMPLNNETFTRLEQIETEAHTRGRTLLQHALKSLLEQPAVISLVTGVKGIDQLNVLIDAVA